MTIGRRFASAMFMLALAGPAFAQYGMPTPQPPQSMPNQGQPTANSGNSGDAPTTPATPAELRTAAACMIERHAASADALFGTAPFSSAERQQALRMLDDLRRCAHRQTLTSSPPMIRGALAEAAVAARFATPAAARTPALDAAPVFRVDRATTLADAASLTSAYAMAQCAAGQHPELVRPLLATEPDSPAASAALTALSPAFHACVTPGTRINVDARMLRSLLAESLYRWSVVQRDGPASPWAAAAPAATASAQ